MVQKNITTDKPNDWFVVNVLNPNWSFETLSGMNVLPENTGLKDAAYYKEQPGIQKLFKDKNNNFDEKAFIVLYDGLVKSYNDFALNKYDLNAFTKSVAYSSNDFLAPKNAVKQAYRVGITKIFNPTNLRVGIENIGTWSEGDLSMREVAQTQEVKDQSGKGLGFTPNDDSKSGLWDFTIDTLFGSGAKALAQWTEDGQHLDPFTEQTITHKKGEYKYNEFGKPFYETLEGKSSVNRSLLSSWDTITDDGSFADQYNFMSGDDKDKSLLGSIMRSAARITPYAIPGLGQWYALGTAALTALEFTPQIANMVGGLIGGDSYKGTDINKFLNKQESFFKTLTANTTSDYSAGKIFTWENMLTMVPEIFIQLSQQRAIGKLPDILGIGSADAKLLNYIAKEKGPELLLKVKSLWAEAEKVKDPGEAFLKKQMGLLVSDDFELGELYSGWIKYQNKISKGLAVGYMTAASSGGIEEIADQFDIGTRDGAWMKLGILLAFWFEMNHFSFGDWLVEYAVGVDDVAKSFNKELKTMANSFKAEGLRKAEAEGVITVAKETSEKSFIKSLKGISGADFFKKGQELGKKITDKINTKAYLQGMSKEALEEMSEETFTDGAKIAYNVFFNLGLTQNKEKRIDWENDSILARYAMAGVGGALGGAMFSANDVLNKPTKENIGNADFGRLAINMIRNGESTALYEKINKLKESKDGFASKDLSFAVVKKEEKDGITKHFFAPADENNLSQNDVIANYLSTSVKLMEKIVLDTKIPSNDKLQSIFESRAAVALEIGEHTAIRDDLVKLTTEYIDIYQKLETARAKKEPNKIDEATINDLTLQLKTKQKQIDELSSEEALGKYYAEALFNLDQGLNRTYVADLDSFSSDKENLSKALFEKAYVDLTPYEKNVVDSDPNDYSRREKLRIAHIIFNKDAKLIRNQVGPIHEFVERRKDIQDKLNQIEFSYTDDESSIDNLVPLYANKGIKEFLNISKLLPMANLEEITPKEALKVKLADDFYVLANALLDKYTSSPDSVTNDEYLLLQYLSKNLGEQDVTEVLLRYNEDPGIIDYLKSLFKDSKNQPDVTTEHLTDVVFTTKIKDLLELLQTDHDPDDFVLDAGDFMPLQNPFRLTFEYLKSKDSFLLQQIEKQILLFNRLQNMSETLGKNESLSLLESLMKQLDVQLMSKQNNVFDLIEGERKRLLEKPIEEYVLMSEITNNEIERLVKLIDRLQIVLHAYINFSQDKNTAIGYFPAINDYNKRNGIKELFEQLTIDSAAPLFAHMDYIAQRLLYLQDLSQKNINSKIPNKQKAEIVMNVLQTRSLVKILNNIVVPSEEDKDLSFKEAISKLDDLYTADFSEKELKSKLEDLNIDESESILNQILSFEHEVFNILTKVKDGSILLNTILQNISFEKIEKEIVEESFTEYSKTATDVKELDKLVYTLSTLVGDSHVFLKDLNNLMTTQPMEFAMFGDQQNALKLAHHFLQSTFASNFENKSKINIQQALNNIKLRLGGIFERSNNIFFNNVFSIYGILGTGKTDAILNFIAKIAKTRNLNSVALASTRNISEKLLTSVPENMVTNAKEQHLTNLLSVMFGAENHIALKKALKELPDGINVHTTFTGKNEPTFVLLNPNNKIISDILQVITERSTKDLLLGDKLVNLILIDESTQISSVEIALLNTFIENYNNREGGKNKLFTITTGDWRQPGALAEAQIPTGNEEKPIVKMLVKTNAQQFFSLRSIDLNSSIRTENNCKSLNSKVLLNITEEYATQVSVSENKTKQISLKYYNKDKFYGDKSVDYSERGNTHEELLNKLIQQSTGEREDSQPSVAIITEEDNSELIALGRKLNIDVLFKDNMNGVQYDYTLVDLDLSNLKDAFNIYLTYVNGLLTRSKKGSYINKSALSVFSDFKVEFVEDKVIFDIKLPQAKINDYKRSRILLINTLANKLLNSPIVEPKEETIVKTTRKSDDSSKRFTLGESGKVVPIVEEDLLSLLNVIGQKGDVTSNEATSELRKAYSELYVNHEFGNATNDPGSKARKLIGVDPQKKTTRGIMFKAKELFIDNLYAENKKSTTELKLKLIKHINDNYLYDVDDIEMVMYERAFDSTFDKAITGGTYSTILVVLLKISTITNGEKDSAYLPIGAASKDLKDLVESKYGVSGKLINDGEDIFLNSDRLLEFLSPNFNLEFPKERVNDNLFVNKKTTIQNLRDRGFKVSPIYITRKDRLTNTFFANGREFVLVSADPDPNITSENLITIFEEELRQGLQNKAKKGNSTDVIKNMSSLSSGRIRIVGLDRGGFTFNEWYDRIKQSRNEKDSTTRKSLGDSYIASKLFTAMSKEWKLMNEDKSDLKKKMPIELELFSDFFHNLLQTMLVLYRDDESKIGAKLNSNSLQAFVQELDDMTLEARKNLFKEGRASHIFIYLIENALEGGTIYKDSLKLTLSRQEISATDSPVMKALKMSNELEANVKNYISEILKAGEKGKDGKVFHQFVDGKIQYTAQFAVGNESGEQKTPWYGRLNVDAASESYFTISDVIMSNIYLPKSDDLFETKKKEEPKPIVQPQMELSKTQKMFMEFDNLLSDTNGLTLESSNKYIKIKSKEYSDLTKIIEAMNTLNLVTEDGIVLMFDIDEKGHLFTTSGTVENEHQTAFVEDHKKDSWWSEEFEKLFNDWANETDNENKSEAFANMTNYLYEVLSEDNATSVIFELSKLAEDCVGNVNKNNKTNNIDGSQGDTGIIF